MLDEKALRKESFAEGVPIRLADGRDWSFPRPELPDFFPILRGGGDLRLGAVCSFGPEYDRLLEALDAAEEFPDRIRALMALAIDLLRRNYELSDADLARLLRYRPHDPACLESWREIAAVAQGLDGPKPSAGGSGSSSG